MSKAMDALLSLENIAYSYHVSCLSREHIKILRDYITTTEAHLNAALASSGKTKAEERDDISIHMQMLCTDDMRADACADAKAHDLPFQVFRILGGYSEALDRLTKSAARIKELEARIADYVAVKACDKPALSGARKVGA